MSQFTYLIGAGASANTIPIINQFGSELIKFTSYLDDYKVRDDSYPNYYEARSKPSEIKKRFVADINWLIKECNNHSSVDTLMRKLFLSNRMDELIKAKEIINEFLLFLHFQKGIDKRYDTFFATILDNSNGLSLPKNIKIVSWNYDKQIEFSVAQFQSLKASEFIERFIQLSPRNEGTAIDINDFCVFKLNGSIGGTEEKGGQYRSIALDYSIFGKKIIPETEENIVKEMLFSYNTTENAIQLMKGRVNAFNEYRTIMYSWEKSPVFNLVRTNALNATKDTNFLIIIGYSFPTFNRIIDKQLLKNMGKLERVFIQSPSDTIEGVIQRFKSLYESGVSVQPITNVEEFYIPFEF